MSLWDSITGRKSSSAALSPPPDSSSSSEFVAESDYSSAPPPQSFATTNGGFATPLEPSGSLPAFLNDPSLLHPLSGLSTDKLEYLKLEDSPLAQQQHNKTALPARGFSDDLCYGTGCTYLAALSIGGALGFVEGLRRVPAAASPKLRLNAILNGVTRRGPFLGNSAGVIALGYNCVNYSIGYLAGRTPLAKSDKARSILAGGLTGMIFKSTRGTKPMLISGGIVASAAAIWSFGKEHLI